MLKTAEARMKKPNNNSSPTALVLAIHYGSTKRKRFCHSKGKGKGKVGLSDHGPKRKDQPEIAPSVDPSEAISFYY